MLERKSRITSRKDFTTLFKSAKTFSAPHLLLKVRKTTSSVSRFAFVVSTKVSKRAVVRNRIKRQLRAIIRVLYPQIKPGYEVIISAKPTILTQGYAQLMLITKEVCQKAGLFTDK